MRVLSEANFRGWIADLQKAIGREHGSPRGVASYSELIGNVCWHFAPEEAGRWFQRSLELRRSVGWEPNSVSAGLLWKLGDREGLRAECLKGIKIHEARVRELKGRERTKDHDKAREQQTALYRGLHEVALLHFLLEDFPKAKEWAEVGIEEDMRWYEWDPSRGQTPSGAYVFVRDASTAILGADAATFRQALNRLRAQLEMWPTDAGNMLAELYRFGSWLGPQYLRKEVLESEPS